MEAMPTITVVEDAGALAEEAAALFRDHTRKSVEERGTCFVAVSGGSTPRAMHRRLARSPYLQDVPWPQIHLFWVDDRCVPVDDPDSNFGNAREDFIESVPFKTRHVHPMPVEDEPEQGASRYGKVLSALPRSPSGIPRFDLVFLGLGPDGHTASLFPGQQTLEEKEKWVVAVNGGNPFVWRLSMTFPVLNEARHVVFLATGKKKALMVKAVLEEKKNMYPAEKIQPENGLLTWLLDREAAALLASR